MAGGLRAYITPWRTELLAELAAARSDVLLVCPYIKSTIVRSIRGALHNGARVRTISRFVEREFRTGSSDIEAHYWLSGHDGSSGFALRRLDHVHAKVFLIDRRVAFVGSANLTLSGLLRNFESIVRIEDEEAVAQIADQMEVLWDRCPPVAASQFADMARLLRRPAPEPVVREEEHVYAAAKLPAFAPEAEAGPASFVNLQLALADTARTEEAALAPVPIEAPAEPSDERDRQGAKIETALAIVKGFQAALLSRFGDLVLPHLRQLALAVRSDFLPSLARQAEGLSGDDLDTAAFFSASLEAIEVVGRQTYELACLAAAMRSGLLGAYGVTAAEIFLREAEKPEHLLRHWNRALLGPAPSLEAEPSRGERLQAVRRLHGLMVKHAGLEAALAMIEDGFNPLDAVAPDIDEVLSVRDPKSTLQEVLALRGSRPPVYAGHVRSGADHAPTWTCLVRGAKFEVEGRGARRSDAEVDAARQCLREMEADPSWSPHVRNWRQAFFDRARRDRPVPLYPPVRLPPRMADSIADVSRTVLPLPLNPAAIAVAVTDPQARLCPGAIDADNRTLAAVGARLVQMVIGLELNAGRIPDHRAGIIATDDLGAFIDLPRLRRAASIATVPTSRQVTESVQAVVAAVFLEHGFEALRAWLSPRLAQAARTHGPAMPTQDNLRGWLAENCTAFVPGAVYTSALQNLQHVLGKEAPTYVRSKSGPSHAPTLTVRVSWEGLAGRGEGSNLKEARQRAAFDLLRQAASRGIEWPDDKG